MGCAHIMIGPATTVDTNNSFIARAGTWVDPLALGKVLIHPAKTVVVVGVMLSIVVSVVEYEKELYDD